MAKPFTDLKIFDQNYNSDGFIANFVPKPFKDVFVFLGTWPGQNAFPYEDETPERRECALERRIMDNDAYDAVARGKYRNKVIGAPEAFWFGWNAAF
jgi:hypothetical protein